MKKLVSVIGIGLLFAGFVNAQSLNSRNVAAQDNYSRSQTTSTLNIRIENSQVWINGNRIPDAELPESLRGLDPAIFYQAAIFGIEDVSFNLMGRDYLVREERIVDVTPTRKASYEAYGGGVDSETKEAYYSQMKRDSPNLFYSLNREAALYDQVRKLILDYQMAHGRQKTKIRTEIQEVLSELFDLNERNRELEIQQLEQLLEAAKEEVKFRKKNKGVIIDRAMDDLLGD